MHVGHDREFKTFFIFQEYIPGFPARKKTSDKIMLGYHQREKAMNDAFRRS